MTTTAPPTNPEVADRLGVHFTTVSKYRNGTRVPSRSVCVRIADEYRIKLADVLAAAEDPQAFGALMRSRVFRERG